MKKAAFAIILLAVSLSAYAQGDRRGFQGTVNSAVKQTIRAGGNEETKVNTPIQFTGRSIEIEGESYEIVKKTFDGKNKTVFTCTKRRGTFEITFTAGESIQVVDTGNKEVETVYKSLSE
ncbi:MAG: hypothetical protein RIA63_00535 [Cyclobacteriaceae bacterium]